MLIFQITIYDEDIPDLRCTSVSRVDLDGVLRSGNFEASFATLATVLRRDWDDALGGFIERFQQYKENHDA